MEPVHLTFDSWASFIEAAQLPQAWYASHSHSRIYGDSDWRGTDTFEEAINFALYGWPAGRARMVQTMATADVRLPSSYRSEALDVAGAYPMVPTYLAGDPACMVDLGDQAIASHPIVRLAYALSVPAMVSGDAIMRHGIALLSIADNLEASGYSVEISLLFGTISQGEIVQSVKAVFKRAGDKLDLDRAAFALANPATFRRFKFSLLEQYKHLSAVGDSYGMSPTKPEQYNLDPDQIYIPPAGASATIEGSLAIIGKALEGANIRCDWADLVEKASA